MVGGALVNSIKIKSGGGDYNVNFFESLKEISNTINHKNNFFIIDKFVFDNFNLINKKFEKNIVSVFKPDEKIKTLKIIEEISLNNKWIKEKEIKYQISFYGNCEYSKYLKHLI